MVEVLNKIWKSDVLDTLFNEEQASRIRSISLSSDKLSDEIIWRFDGTDNYSVKSGYRLLRAEQARSFSTDFSAFFTTIWAANVPAKVKVTMWRIVKKFLPTFQNLQSRRLLVSNVCAICKSHGESVEHLMRDCNFVQQIMQRLGLPTVANPDADPWMKWIASYFVSLSGRDQRVLLVLYWAVWFARNKMVHEGKLNSVDDVAAFIVAFLQEQDILNQVLPLPTRVCDAPWQAPSKSIIKLNFDSSYFSRTASVTSGIIARNSRGLIMAACSFPHRNVVDAFVAEAYACKQAVCFAKDLGFTRVIIEGDLLTIIKKLNSGKVDRSVVYPIIQDIQALSQEFANISFCFVRREAIRRLMCWLKNVVAFLLLVTGWRRRLRPLLLQPSLIGGSCCKLTPASPVTTLCFCLISRFLLCLHFEMHTGISFSFYAGSI
ncbi:hypothetical protein V6N11_052494 [Hibiscus sabdariffa]|uniref:Reverse transcriptase n=1 Tax=Hibiscus sabdariffa TaxID=183260 RepID=A0ABR2UAY8_9ROSI